MDNLIDNFIPSGAEAQQFHMLSRGEMAPAGVISKRVTLS